MLKCALRVKLCFTNCEIIPRWAKRSFAQAEIFRTNLPNSGAAVGGAATRNQPCCIKNVKWFCTTLVEGLGTNQGPKPGVEPRQQGPKKIRHTERVISDHQETRPQTGRRGFQCRNPQRRPPSTSGDGAGGSGGGSTRPKLLFHAIDTRKRPRVAGPYLGAPTRAHLSRKAKLRPSRANSPGERSRAEKRGSPYLSLSASDPILANGESR